MIITATHKATPAGGRDYKCKVIFAQILKQPAIKQTSRTRQQFHLIHRFGRKFAQIIADQMIKNQRESG